MGASFWSIYMEERRRVHGFKTHEEMAEFLNEPRANVTKWFNGSWPREEDKIQSIVERLGGNPFAGMMFSEGKRDAVAVEADRLRARNAELEAELVRLRAIVENIQRSLSGAAPETRENRKP